MEKITPETLKEWLGAPDVFIIDLRNPTAWEEGADKIQGAYRFDPQKVSDWARDLPRERKLVLY